MNKLYAAPCASVVAPVVVTVFLLMASFPVVVASLFVMTRVGAPCGDIFASCGGIVAPSGGIRSLRWWWLLRFLQ